MATTPLCGLTYPALSDSPNGPSQIQQLATDIDPQLYAARTVRQVARSAALSLPTSTSTAANAWDLATQFTYGDITYGSGLFTVGTTGFYEWETTVDWPATGSGAVQHIRQCYVYVNGSENANHEGKSSWLCPAGVNNAVGLTGGGKLPLSAGDTVQAVFYQNSGGTLSLNPRTFTLRRIA